MTCPTRTFCFQHAISQYLLLTMRSVTKNNFESSLVIAGSFSVVCMHLHDAHSFPAQHVTTVLQELQKGSSCDDTLSNSTMWQGEQMMPCA